MRSYYFTIFMTLCIFSCHAQMIQVNDMKEVMEYFNTANSKTLAIFDVDMVLVQPSDPAFQMANMKRFGAVLKCIMKEVPVEKQMMFLSLMTISTEPVLIDECTPQFLNSLWQRGVPTIALTANLTGTFGPIKNMENWRIQNLKVLGIDFSQAAPFQKSFIFNDLASYRDNYSTYIDGVLFVNGTSVSKGDAFLSFLKKTNFLPEKIIFIDDREDNLKSLEAAIQTLDHPIEYQGLHFLGAQKYPSKSISEEEFEAKWQTLAKQVKELD
ncbi:MAG: hypothetical protein BGO14_09060 [Chlamydiales bacterium 38-26]|nr:DUF2608 domain-containing protein [Chlamydiales bacterium]OJV11127.1 MAG: hypothetical protein BGO14_09060 [Chlamydiales bacterium 38-26]